MSGDLKTWRPPAWAVRITLGAMAIVGAAVWWVLDTRFPDTDLPTPRLEALPGDGHAILQWEFDDHDAPDAPSVKLEYEQRYAEREGQYNPPDRWKPLPEDGVVTGLTNGWGYVFRVRAGRGKKRGRPSNEAVVTPTAVPARLDEIAELTRALGRDVVTTEQWQAAASRMAEAIEQGFENLTRVTDGRGAESAERLAALRQSLDNLSLPATDERLAAIEVRLAGIEKVLTVGPPTPVTDEQWTELMVRLTAIATHLKTIASETPPRSEETERNPASPPPDDPSPGGETERGQEQPSPTAPARTSSSPGGETEQEEGQETTLAETEPEPDSVPGSGPRTTSAEIAPELTRFHFPNARLADGVPAGDGVAVPEQEVNRTLAALGACARDDDPVTVRPYGFASDASFLNADGTPMARSDALNLKTANLRARNAYRELTARADAYPRVQVEEQHEWSSLEQMKQKRDDGSLIPHSDDEQERERMRRVVVLEVTAPDGCAFESDVNPASRPSTSGSTRGKTMRLATAAAVLFAVPSLAPVDVDAQTRSERDAFSSMEHAVRAAPSDSSPRRLAETRWAMKNCAPCGEQSSLKVNGRRRAPLQ